MQAKDDPIIPFHYPAFQTNPNLQLIAVDHGGHLGFLARGPQRFWLDPVVLGWISGVLSHAPSASRP